VPARLPPLALAVAQRALQLGGVLLIAGWLGYFFIALTPGLDAETFRATVLLHVVTCAVLIPYLLYTLLRGRLPGDSPLDWPIALLIGAYALTTVTSIAWRVSLESSLLALGALGVFAVLSDTRVFRRWQVESGLMLAVVAAATYGVWKAGVDYADWLRLNESISGPLSFRDLIPPTVPRIHGVSDFVTILGMVLGMAVPLYLSAALRRGVARPLGIVGGLLVLLALFLTLTRGAWAGAAAGSAVALVGALALRGSGGWRDVLRMPSLSRRGWLAAGAIAAAALIVLALPALAAASLDSRPGWLFRASVSPRRQALDAGLDLFADHPLVGIGPGAYGQLVNIHSGYVHLAAELGVVGLLAFAALVAGVLWLLFRAVPRAAPPTRLSLLAAAGAFTAVAVHGLVDTPNIWKASLVAVAAVGALLVQAWRESAPDEPRSDVWWLHQVGRHAPRVLIVLALASLPIWWARLDLAHYHYSQGVVSANEQSWDRALAQARDAARLDPSLAIYQLQLGQLEVRVAQERRDRGLLQSGIQQLERAVDLEPRGALGFANLALARSQAGDREGARAAALAAIERRDAFVNDDASVVLAAATVLEENGWEREAVDAYRRVLTSDARLADSPFWSKTRFRRDHFLEIVEGSVVALNQCLMLQLHATSEDERLKSSLLPFDDALYGCTLHVVSAPNDLSLRVRLAGGLIAAGAFDEALAHLNFALGRQPDFGPAHTTLGELHAAQGRLDEARAEWVEAAQLDEAQALVLLGDSYPQGQVPPEVVSRLRSKLSLLGSYAQSQDISVLYYRMMFGRASPWVMLIPGDWQDAVPRDYADAQAALERWQRDRARP